MLQTGRQYPVFERRAVTPRAGLSGEHWDVMPGIVDRLVATETAHMLADNGPVLADDNALGVNLDLDRPTHRTRGNRILVVVAAHQAGLGHRGLRRAEPVEPTADRHELGALGLKDLPDRLVGQFRMPVRLGISEAPVEQPSVQLVIARDPP